MRVLVFGRVRCRRTQGVLVRLRDWILKSGLEGGVALEFVDLDTTAGLAEAAYRQLGGRLPAVVVEASAGSPGWSRLVRDHPEIRLMRSLN